MSEKDYRKAILEKLLKKYEQRLANPINTNRRVIVKPAEIYRNYTSNHADIAEKQRFDEAVEGLLRMGIVQVERLRFGTDIERIYLCGDHVAQFQAIMKNEYGIMPQDDLRTQLEAMLNDDHVSGLLVLSYEKNIRDQMEDSPSRMDIQSVKKNLEMLRFLETNKKNLYIREASMLVYGDSKWFEQHNLKEVCEIIRQALGIPREEGERTDTILAEFQIYPAEQEVFIKGDWKIEWEGYVLETKTLQGGVAIASSDIPGIKTIQVNAPQLMTIENKTAYHRISDKDLATLYLGGFATRYQIDFLKKTGRDNPGIRFLHFGDIDVGGFLIHAHLCRATSIAFALYAMGCRQLEDVRFRDCLKPLTPNDRSRMEQLMGEEPYREVLQYMDKHDVKLEQEIVSYYLQKDREPSFV